MTITLLTGDCRDVLPTLASNSVHCVVTSPPYYGLRDYGTALWDGGDAACEHADAFNDADPVPPSCRQCQKCGRLCRTKWLTASSVRSECDLCQITTDHADVATRGTWETIKREADGAWIKPTARLTNLCVCGARRIDRQIGLEATPDAYIATVVAVFREVRRVLRPDGTCWVNLGDSYARGTSNNGGYSAKSTLAGFTNPATKGRVANDSAAPRRIQCGAKPKDLLMMPARLALALQADGWWLRSAIVWSKPNPMPESCQDRPTSAYEMVYLLTRSARYFYDADAVREEAINEGRVVSYDGTQKNTGHENRTYPGCKPRDIVVNGRNLRNVWTIATAPYAEAHFATYPPALVERCIRAGTSERGCCAACGAPWVRITEKGPPDKETTRGLQPWAAVTGQRDSSGGLPLRETLTTGWRAGCQCNAETQPCTVLDPFLGSGTTALVADRLQRHCIGIDLSTTYADLARHRVTDDCPLFTSWAPADDPEDARMADLFAEAAE